MAIDPLDAQIEALRRRLAELQYRIEQIRLNMVRLSWDIGIALRRGEVERARLLQSDMERNVQELERLRNEYQLTEQELRNLQMRRYFRRMWPSEYGFP